MMENVKTQVRDYRSPKLDIVNLEVSCQRSKFNAQ
jgi:hypothetical protein